MTAPTSNRNTYVPPELQEKIFQHSSKTDLQNIRLACREFNQVATPFLYKELVVQLDLVRQKLDRRPIFTFGDHVKQLKILVVQYDKWKPADYITRTKERCMMQQVDYDEQLTRKSYETYNYLRRAHKRALDTGLTTGYLMSLIAHLPHLEAVLVSDGACRFPMSGSDEERAWNYVQLYYEPGVYTVIPPSCGDRILPVDYCNLLAKAFSGSRSCFTRFSVLGSFGSSCGDFGLCPEVLNDTVLELEQTTSFIKKLTTLQLDFNCSDSIDVGIQVPALAKVLSQAESLEILNLAIVYDVVDFNEILQGCKYPKLRICLLSNFESSAQQLIEFLSTPEKLTHLRLMEYDLADLTWEEVVPRLRDILPYLQAIHLADVDADWQNNRVENYFFRNGPNPFVADSMARDFKNSNSNYDTAHLIDEAEGSEASEDEIFNSDDGLTKLLDELWYAP
ncbi:MAG: hypothetical protein Q9215_006609 [Flavoplaca cf. flavocitrina]